MINIQKITILNTSIKRINIKCRFIDENTSNAMLMRRIRTVISLKYLF